MSAFLDDFCSLSWNTSGCIERGSRAVCILPVRRSGGELESISAAFVFTLVSLMVLTQLQFIAAFSVRVLSCLALENLGLHYFVHGSTELTEICENTVRKIKKIISQGDLTQKPQFIV